jgi:hypothetical protein
VVLLLLVRCLQVEHKIQSSDGPLVLQLHKVGLLAALLCLVLLDMSHHMLGLFNNSSICKMCC